MAILILEEFWSQEFYQRELQWDSCLIILYQALLWCETGCNRSCSHLQSCSHTIFYLFIYFRSNEIPVKKLVTLMITLIYERPNCLSIFLSVTKRTYSIICTWRISWSVVVDETLRWNPLRFCLTGGFCHSCQTLSVTLLSLTASIYEKSTVFAWYNRSGDRMWL